MVNLGTSLHRLFEASAFQRETDVASSGTEVLQTVVQGRFLVHPMRGLPGTIKRFAKASFHFSSFGVVSVIHGLCPRHTFVIYTHSACTFDMHLIANSTDGA